MEQFVYEPLFTRMNPDFDLSSNSGNTALRINSMKPYLRTKDYSITGEEFSLLYDEVYHMLVTNPRPDNLERYYDSEVYISHTDSKKTLIEKLYRLVKSINLKRKVKLASNYAENDKSILDIGSGTGDFLLTAKEKSWSISGVEPNRLARENSKAKGVEVFSSINDIKGKRFKIITLWHVLEHLPELEKQLMNIKQVLKPDGTLIVAVPNYKSYDAKHYKAYWAAYDVPRHLWHFSRDSIALIFAKQNMKIVETRPMYFDSFYVSILSENYKGSKWAFLRGFLNGLYSNLRALSTKEYSSLIYVIKNK